MAHNVYYVNDALTAADTFTTAAGSAANDGLTPATPMDSVQTVLNTYAMGAGDVILVDSGSYVGGFAITSADKSFAIVGSGGVPSALAGATSIAGTQSILIQGLELDGALTVTGTTSLNITSSTLGNITLSGNTGTLIQHSASPPSPSPATRPRPRSRTAPSPAH